MIFNEVNIENGCGLFAPSAGKSSAEIYISIPLNNIF